MTRAGTGMVYVATRRPHYVAEAFLSASSARDFAPDLPITLYTDLPDLPFCRSSAFTSIVPLATQRNYQSLWAEGQLDRVRSLRESPYEHTLHLDSDTRVMTPEFVTLFDHLHEIDIGMAICQPDVSKCAQMTGLPMFNVGFILFRRSVPVSALLADWEELTRRNFALGNQPVPPSTPVTAHLADPEIRREALFMDQTSLVEILSPDVNRHGLHLEIMDESWNFRGTGVRRHFDRPVKISHHPSLRGRLGEDIILRVGEYVRQGQRGLARELLQCLHDQLVPAENVAGKQYVQGLLAQL